MLAYCSSHKARTTSVPPRPWPQRGQHCEPLEGAGEVHGVHVGHELEAAARGGRAARGVRAQRLRGGHLETRLFWRFWTAAGAPSSLDDGSAS